MIHLLKVFYYEKSVHWGFIMAMLVWFMGLRELFVEKILQGLPYIALVICFSALIIDEIVFLYDGQMEVKMRSYLDEEGLILPWHYESDRLEYRALRPSDWKLIRALSQDPQVYEFVDDIDEALSRSESKRWTLDHMNLERTALRCTRVIVDKSSGKSIGGLVIINGHELEYWFKPSFRGIGLAYEAVRASIDSIEEHENLVLFAKSYLKNIKSRKLLSKIGFDEVPSNTNEKEETKSHWVYHHEKRRN